MPCRLNQLLNNPFENQNPAFEVQSEDIKKLLAKDPKPYAPTVADRIFSYLKPFLKYVFNLRPAIPNIIYVLVSVGAMQLLKAKEFFPKIDWLVPIHKAIVMPAVLFLD